MAAAGMLVISASNSYSGPTTVSNGTLQLGSSNALPVGAVVTVNGLLDLNTFNASITSLSGSGTIDTVAGGTPTLTVSSGDFKGTLQNSYSSGALALDKIGAGTLILDGTGLYTGGTTVESGTLDVASPTALADGSSLTVGDGMGSEFVFDRLSSISSIVPAVGSSPAASPVVTLAAVPEPGPLALLIAVFGSTVIYQGIRRRSRGSRRTAGSEDPLNVPADAMYSILQPHTTRSSVGAARMVLWGGVGGQRMSHGDCQFERAVLPAYRIAGNENEQVEVCFDRCPGGLGWLGGPAVDARPAAKEGVQASNGRICVRGPRNDDRAGCSYAEHRAGPHGPLPRRGPGAID